MGQLSAFIIQTGNWDVATRSERKVVIKMLTYLVVYIVSRYIFFLPETSVCDPLSLLVAKCNMTTGLFRCCRQVKIMTNLD
jgi:hypothetical protein